MTRTAKGRFRVVLRVPLKDVDEFGTVWYGNYLAYFDVARTEFFRHFGLTPTEMASLGYYAPVIDTKIQYHFPAHNDDEMVVEVWPEIHRVARITFHFRVLGKKDERLLVTGETSHVLKTTDGVLLYRVPPVLAEKIDAILKNLEGIEEET